MHSRLPSMSIVVPSYNQGPFLSRNLESIFSQNYPNLEVILMDGGSTDESVEVIHRFEDRLKFWRSHRDAGQAAAINEGMSHAAGTLVGWLDADDFYVEDSLWTVGRAYAAHPDFGLYIGNGFCYNQSEDRYTPFCPRHIAFNRDALLHGLDYIFQPSTFFLRSAWQEAHGLNDALHYVMDWDIILRISEKYPAVLVNDFLAARREHEEEKTSTKTIKRALEILRAVQMRSGGESFPGSLHDLLETLSQSARSSDVSDFAPVFERGIREIRQQFAERFGNSDGFPENGDPQDKVYISVPISGQQPPRLPIPLAELPTISIVMPSYNQAAFLSQALDSILNQSYPRLEILVIDGGSTDGSVEVLQEYSDRLTYWVSEPDRGPAHAINKGFERATGDILGWLSSDDSLAVDSLWKVAQAFVEDPRLDMVYANAVYIDENNELFLADHGTHRTGLYYGRIADPARVYLYWTYVHAVPQPTVYFRRHLLKRCGNLNERYQFIFDFELFARFSRVARIRKIERTQAFYRISTASKTSSWGRFTAELYQLSRPTWPSLWSREFYPLLVDYVRNYLRRNVRYGRRDVRFWMIALLVTLMVVTRTGNPEALAARYRSSPKQVSPRRLPSGFRVVEQYLPQVAAAPDKPRYKAIFCSLNYPRFPGRSGGEIRDFYLLKHLASSNEVKFLSFYPTIVGTQIDLLQKSVSRINPPKNLWLSLTRKMYALYYRLPGRTFHREVRKHLHLARTAARSLQALLKQEQPDFLFISPQLNPIAIMLSRENIRTRFVLATYDVEAVRIERMIKSARTGLLGGGEASRARRFEAANLQNYDAIIAVSEIDKHIFQQQYGFPGDRILTIENSVEANHFAFKPRRPNVIPQVIFTASFTYSPNVMAAWRLIERIMPLVRGRFPAAVLWLVGQRPPDSLSAASDNQHTVVTGDVDDVRPYLAYASLSCVPLDAGSGTKYKILEALSAGVPVVCTPLAAEGLEIVHGKHVLIGQSDQELADAIIQLLEDPSLTEMMAQRGRRLIEKRYTWDANLAKLDRWLETIAGLPPRRVNNVGGL